MPAATTHALFALDALDHFSIDFKKKITNKNLFCLGSEGPDLFFFSHFVALPNSLKKYGDAMHSEKVKETISFIRDYCKKETRLFSYYAGFMCHYVLDSYAHPLINRNSELYAETYKLSPGLLHIHSEAEIDCHVLKNHHKTVNDYNVYEYLAIGRESANLLATMYTKLFYSVYGLNIPKKEILETIKGIKRLTKLLRPQSTKKYQFVCKVEDIVHAPKFISGMMLNNKKSDASVFNTDHSITFSFALDDHSTLSFDELYDLALRDVEEYINNSIEVTRDFVGQVIPSPQNNDLSTSY